jgi:hypothetical protein
VRHFGPYNLFDRSFCSIHRYFRHPKNERIQRPRQLSTSIGYERLDKFGEGFRERQNQRYAYGVEETMERDKRSQ